MKGMLKGSFFLGVSLLALLAVPPLSLAHDNNARHERLHDRLSYGHERQYDRLDTLHDRYHRNPHSRRSHRRFHRWLEGKHQKGHAYRADLHEYSHERYGRSRDRDNRYGRNGSYRNDWRNTPRYDDRHHDHSHD
ncbi:MAG: hypothetical protein AB7G75_19165 [Candidatus Binatia bacterium]